MEQFLKEHGNEDLLKKWVLFLECNQNQNENKNMGNEVMKKKRTGYQKFFSEMSIEMKKKDGTITFKDISRKISELWHDLPLHEKKQYDDTNISFTDQDLIDKKPEDRKELLMQCTVDQLCEICKNKNLTRRGTKTMLIDRIYQYYYKHYNLIHEKKEFENIPIPPPIKKEEEKKSSIEEDEAFSLLINQFQDLQMKEDDQPTILPKILPRTPQTITIPSNVMHLNNIVSSKSQNIIVEEEENENIILNDDDEDTILQLNNHNEEEEENDENESTILSTTANDESENEEGGQEEDEDDEISIEDYDDFVFDE